MVKNIAIVSLVVLLVCAICVGGLHWRENNNLRAQNSQWRDQVSQRDVQISQLQDQTSQLDTQISQLEGQVSQLQNENSQLQADISILSSPPPIVEEPPSLPPTNEEVPTLEGIVGLEIIDVLEGSGVKDYIDVKEEGVFWVGGLRGDVVKISDRVLTLNRGTKLAIPINEGVKISVAISKWSAGSTSTRSGTFEEIEVNGFVSIYFELYVDEPLRVIRLLFYPEPFKPPS